MSFFFDIALPAAYAGVMVLMGLSLGMEDFRKLFQQPKALILGLLSQMILLPLLAFGLVSLLPLPTYLRIGFILLAACPGGSTSNLASYMLRGNVALSVSLTTVNSFLVIFSVPIILSLGSYFFDFQGQTTSLPFWETVLRIVLLTVLPCVAGILFRAKWTRLAKRLEKIFKWIMPGLLALSIVGGAFFGKNDGPAIGISDYLEALPTALILNISSMLMGLLLAKLLKLSTKDQFTIGIEVGIQNSALAITIASGALFLNDPQLGIPAIVYMLFPFFTALIFGYFVNRRNLKQLFARKKRQSH